MKDTIVDMATQPVEFVLSEKDFFILSDYIGLAMLQNLDAVSREVHTTLLRIHGHLYSNIEMRVKR